MQLLFSSLRRMLVLLVACLGLLASTGYASSAPQVNFPITSFSTRQVIPSVPPVLQLSKDWLIEEEDEHRLFKEKKDLTATAGFFATSFCIQANANHYFSPRRSVTFIRDYSSLLQFICVFRL